MSEKNIGKLAGVALFLSGLAGTLSAQVTHYVRPENTNAASPYTSWETAATSILDAVAAANANNAGDTVLISNGLYAITNTVTVQNTVVRGFSGDRTAVVVNGGGSLRCFWLSHAGAFLADLTVSNANTGGYGGGVYAPIGSVSNCIITKSYASWGGGIYLLSGLVTDCLITSNTASYSAGVYISGADALLRDSTIAGNVATYHGGGVYATNCLVTNCLITGNGTTYNSGSYGGGGVSLWGPVRMANCVVSNNWAPASAFAAGVAMHGNATASWCTVVGNTNASAGGGVRMQAGANVVEYCTIADNVCGSIGGGVHVNSFGNLIRDCVIRSNTASSYGGGIYMRIDSTVSNCIVTGNRGAYGGGIYTAIGTNMLVTHSTISSNTAFAAVYGGGGMFIADGGTFSHCAIVGNQTTNITSYGGGGIYLRNLSWSSGSNTTILRNCLIAGNSAAGDSSGEGQGGGLHLFNNPYALVQNCTIAGNTGYVGGGLYRITSGMMENTIIYDNSASSANSNWYASGSGFFTNCCAAPTSAIFNAASTDLPPGYDADYRLLRGSPCVNTAVYRSWMDDAMDLAGSPRLDPVWHLPDIGCYEMILSRGTMFLLR